MENVKEICMEENLRSCEICGELASFERVSPDLPHEGEICILCDTWVCNDCVDWGASGDAGSICKKCATGE